MPPLHSHVLYAVSISDMHPVLHNKEAAPPQKWGAAWVMGGQVRGTASTGPWTLLLLGQSHLTFQRVWPSLQCAIALHGQRGRLSPVSAPM